MIIAMMVAHYNRQVQYNRFCCVCRKYLFVEIKKPQDGGFYLKYIEKVVVLFCLVLLHVSVIPEFELQVKKQSAFEFIYQTIGNFKRERNVSIAGLK